MYRFDGTDSSLIRTRINENLLKVKDESADVRKLLKLSLHTTGDDSLKTTHAFGDIDFCSRCTSRKDLLRTAIILATSRNTEASENLMDVIATRLGTIKDKDYRYIASLICNKDKVVVERINNLLSFKLNGYFDMHCKYYKQYYGI